MPLFLLEQIPAAKRLPLEVLIIDLIQTVPDGLIKLIQTIEDSVTKNSIDLIVDDRHCLFNQ